MDIIKQQKLLDLVKRNYEDIAADFDVTRKKALWPTLSELAVGVKDGDRILDVGCGNGRLLKAFAGKAISYIGTDLSASLIGLAKKNYGQSAGGSDCKFYVGDILNLDRDVAGQFEWIFSIAVIHHLPSPELRIKALKNLQSKLVPGGRIVISVWRPWGNKKMVRELLRTIGRKLIGRHPYAWNDLVFAWHNNQSLRYYHLFTKCELKKLMKKSGLQIIEFKKEQRNYYLVLK